MARLLRLKKFKMPETKRTNKISTTEGKAISYEGNVVLVELTKEVKWKMAATVVDRFFFYFSLIYFIITLGIFLLSIKNFYKLT